MLGPTRKGVASAPIVRMRGISKQFPEVLANDGVDFDLYPGEIRGLLGENGAGKTTLMKILYGLMEADSGDIEVKGSGVRIRAPRMAIALGIGMVHQQFMLVPNLTVCENVALGLARGFLRPLALRTIAAKIRRLASKYQFAINPDAIVAELSVGERQRVEILKMLYRGADILILDEPTGVLTPPEWRELAVVLRGLARDGKSVVLITHKLDEVRDVARDCTVMRDGRVIDTVDLSETGDRALAQMMIGREVNLTAPRREGPVAPTEVLRARDLRLVNDQGRTLLENISFTIHAGEILGIAGVEGNGQQQLVEVLTGWRAPTDGTLVMAGRCFEALTPAQFIQSGGALIPEDRHRQGVADELTLLENLVLDAIASAPLSKYGFIDLRTTRERARKLIEQYNIRPARADAIFKELSGGNQQRAVLARELHRNPKLLIAAQPTRGLDVAAVSFVYEQLGSHRDKGGGTLLISAELDEVLALSDRVAIMVRGRFVKVLDARHADPERVGLLMAGGAET